MENMEKRISEMEQTIEELRKEINAYKVDRQFLLKQIKSIKPGVATKVIYDNKGLIVGTANLDPSDIPNIPIEKVDGLNTSLSKFATTEQLNSVDGKISDALKHGQTEYTGCKVNVDANGRVNEVFDLSVEDVPQLPIDHIDGLSDIINQLKLIKSEKKDDEFAVVPGIATKVVYDNKGRIVGSEQLTVDDIPSQIISKLNELSAANINMATRDQLNHIRDILNNEIQETSPGTYTKVEVLSNGKVMAGSSLTPSDIPTLPISKVSGLSEALSDSPSREEFINLSNTVSLLSTLNNKPATVQVHQSSNDDALRASIEDLKNKLNKIYNYNPVASELEKLRADLSALSGRIAQLEKKK